MTKPLTDEEIATVEALIRLRVCAYVGDRCNSGRCRCSVHGDGAMILRLLADLRAARAERDALRKVQGTAERLRARRGYGAGYETNEVIDAVLSALDACPKAGGGK